MILLSYSSLTQTEWCLVEDGRSAYFVVERAYTDGINPYFQQRKEISRLIRLQLPPSIFKRKVSKIFFYGAGCSTEQKKNVVQASLETQFRTPSEVHSDLLAAARGMFLNEAGIACILDVGSNSCFYDGNRVVKNVKPLGYILGDEGSGAALGKAFVSDLLKGLAPLEFSAPFEEKYGVDADSIMECVYSKPTPSKSLAMLSNFLSEHVNHPYVKDLVLRNFNSFFERNVLQYDYKTSNVRFVGRIAATYPDILIQSANNYGIVIDNINDTPMKGLVEYHELINRNRD